MNEAFFLGVDGNGWGDRISTLYSITRQHLRHPRESLFIVHCSFAAWPRYALGKGTRFTASMVMSSNWSVPAV